MDRYRDNDSDNDGQSVDLPNLPNSHTFPLNSPSWYTPASQLAPSNSFARNQSLQNSSNYDETSIPSNAYGESFVSSRGSGSSHLESRVAITPCFDIDFTNQVITPLNRTTSSGCNMSRNYTKRLWTVEEDSKLNALVSVFGTKNWAVISDFMDGRAGKQCRERWNNNLRPNIKSDVWSEEEEGILIEAHEKMGNKWSQIAKLLPGRTENAIKNHWNAAARKKTMRLNRYKRYEPDNAKPKSTLLRDYIRGMSSKKSPTTSNDNIVTEGELTTLTPQDDQLSSDPILPTYNNNSNINDQDQFSFMKNLFATGDNHMMAQVLEPHGETSSILMEDSLDMYLNDTNDQTDTQIFPDAYLSRSMSEPAPTLCNANETVYGYGDMNMDKLPFNAQGGGFSS